MSAATLLQWARGEEPRRAALGSPGVSVATRTCSPLSLRRPALARPRGRQQHQPCGPAATRVQHCAPAAAHQRVVQRGRCCAAACRSSERRAQQSRVQHLRRARRLGAERARAAGVRGAGGAPRRAAGQAPPPGRVRAGDGLEPSSGRPSSVWKRRRGGTAWRAERAAAAAARHAVASTGWRAQTTSGARQA